MSTHVPSLEAPPGPAGVNVAAEAARRAVALVAITKISTQLRAENPALREGDRACWSVPLTLTSPARGSIGLVGEILVDAATGEVLADAEAVARIAADVEQLARCSPL